MLVLYETMMECSVFFCGNEVALKTFLFVYLRFMRRLLFYMKHFYLYLRLKWLLKF